MMSGTKSQLKRDNSHSQLNIFKESKTEIISIYSDVLIYVKDCRDFFDDIYKIDSPLFKSLLKSDPIQSLQNFVNKVEGIQHVINRNQMKCAFFGRTSNGKSTVVNALIGAKILPAGLGHTTSCFLEIQGTAENKGYIVINNPSNGGDLAELLKPIDSVKELARDVSSNKLPIEALIKIFWPSNMCSLLAEDVVFLDSPGIDVDPDIDKWIDLYCLDADVFVLVANSESTLNHTEKMFFHKVRERLSKPNIFILNNRWDASADEIEYVKEARQQHLERCATFLSKELKVCSRNESEGRVYFVSASEALSNRTKSSNGDSLNTSLSSLREGWQSRYFEFTNFEKHLEKVLSESATKTKFAAHSMQGQEIIGDVRAIVEDVYEHSQEQKDSATELSHKVRSRIEKLETGQKTAHKDSLTDISRLSERAAERVAQVLKEELRRIDELIEQFDRPFFDEKELVAKYKSELSQHVEKQLGYNLASSCSTDLSQQVDSVSKSILKRYLCLLPNQHIGDQIRTRAIDDYIPEFPVDCRNIHSDFQEDLSFRFSLGPTALLYRFLGAPSSIESITTSPLTGGLSTLMTIRNRLPGISSRVILGTILCTGVVLKAAGWRVLAACGVVYGGLYIYEYSTWTGRSKERAFKAQFAAHVGEKLRLMMDFTSRHSAFQPQSVLKNFLKQLNGEVDVHLTQLSTDIDNYEKHIIKLEDIVTRSKTLKNRATYLEQLLRSFHDKYILG